MTPLLAQRSRVDRSFERLYRRHVTDVYHYALAVLRNAADAEDVTQTTFLNAYGAFQRGERPAAPRNWLIAIAHNVCRQRFRQSARRPQEVAFDEDVGETLVEDDAPSAHDIRTALGHLAFNQRAALVMRELEGRSYMEIAEVLGLTVSAVETLIFRARRALREQLEGSLTCRQAELALSRQLDRRLPRAERPALRAHLRACPECASFARSQRAQRAALQSIAAIPLPGSLASFFGGGGATAGAGLAAKAAAVVAAGAVVGGVGYEGVKRLPVQGGSAKAVASQSASQAPSRPAVVEAAAARAAATGSIPARNSVGGTRPEWERAPAKAEAGRGAAMSGRATTAKLSAGREHGRSSSAPGHAATVKATSRGSKAKAHGSRPASRGTAAHQKPKASSSKETGRPEQPGKSDPPGQGKKSPVPVETPTVTTPTVPALPPPPLPEPPKVKK